MKTLLFYEVNELGPLSLRLPELTENEKMVFDTVNNLGAATLRRIALNLGGLTMQEIRPAVSTLVSKQLISRRNLEAHDTD